ncbi:MAG: hypothetical protein NUV81_04355 [bacterium]|nr:hypothetical protein [bacterium]
MMIGAAAWGCSDFVDPTLSDSTTTVTATTNDGGVGGSGGAGGKTTTTTTTADGGTGGSTSGFVFDCTDVEANHLVVKIAAEVKPTGHLGIDGWCDDSAGAWGGLWVEPSADAKRTAWDHGEVFKGTYCELHVGLGKGELFSQKGEMIYNTSSLCLEGSCKVDVLACYGTSKVPLVNSGANLKVKAE